MPDGGVVACLVYKTGKEPRFSLFEENHNVFRLDRACKVMWQVRRNEGGARAQWAQMREKAEADDSGDFEMHSPFLSMHLRFRDGSTNKDPMTEAGPPDACWVEGATVICRTLDSMTYELDVDTGIAVNVTPFGIRPW